MSEPIVAATAAAHIPMKHPHPNPMITHPGCPGGSRSSGARYRSGGGRIGASRWSVYSRRPPRILRGLYNKGIPGGHSADALKQVNDGNGTTLYSYTYDGAGNFTAPRLV